jgi:hypothetical protein
MPSDVSYGEICFAKLKDFTFLSRNLLGRYSKDVNFKILSIFLACGPQYSYQKCHQICSTVKFAEQNSRFNLSQILSRNLYGRDKFLQRQRRVTDGNSSNNVV